MSYHRYDGYGMDVIEKNQSEIVVTEEDTRTCWKKLLAEAMQGNGETLDDIESTTLTSKQIEEKFKAGFGSGGGVPFTAWTRNRVYFPVVYDGRQSVASVSRDPDGRPTRHVGGGDYNDFL